MLLNLSYYEDDDDEEESGDEESYLASYSDLVTDLMAIFVLLLSFALVTVSGSVSTAKAQENSSDLEIVQSMDVIRPNDGEAEAVQQPTAVVVQEDDLEELLRAIQSYIDSEGLFDQLSVNRNGRHQILLRVSDSALFASGKADISSETAQMLTRISDIFNRYEKSIYMIRIEGHTDNRPIKNAQFDSNWELSTSRAVSILRWLQADSMMSAKKFSAVGYGEFQPAADNDTPEGMATNRRVDFIIEAQMPEAYTITLPATTTSAATTPAAAG